MIESRVVGLKNKIKIKIEMTTTLKIRTMVNLQSLPNKCMEKDWLNEKERMN